MLQPIRYFEYNKGALLIEWPKAADVVTLQSIVTTEKHLIKEFKKSIYETVSGYHSLLIYYNDHLISKSDISESISNLESDKDIILESNHWKIPVDYGTEHGIDLDFLSKELQLSNSEIINAHSTPIYTLHFIGFLPGFLYLSGLPDILNIPRRSNPRIRIPKGSVAIAAGQTGIYPIDSPGGWYIIGHTDFTLFDPFADPPCPFQAGDTIQFYNTAEL